MREKRDSASLEGVDIDRALACKFNYATSYTQQYIFFTYTNWVAYSKRTPPPPIFIPMQVPDSAQLHVVPASKTMQTKPSNSIRSASLSNFDVACGSVLRARQETKHLFLIERRQ